MIPRLIAAAIALVQGGANAPTCPQASPPAARRPSFISRTDYPAEALRRHEQGQVGFQLTISSEGRVSACRVTQSSGSPSLDRATCDIMLTRAHFSPACDDHGIPVASTVGSTMHWVLPD